MKYTLLILIIPVFIIPALLLLVLSYTESNESRTTKHFGGYSWDCNQEMTHCIATGPKEKLEAMQKYIDTITTAGSPDARTD